MSDLEAGATHPQDDCKKERTDLTDQGLGLGITVQESYDGDV